MEGRVEGGIRIDRDRLVIEKRDGFDVPRLPGFGPGLVPGAPSLLEQVRYAVLPPGATALYLEVEPGDPVRLPGPVNPWPVQAPVPDVPTEGREPPPGGSITPDATHFRFTPLDPRYLRQRTPYPVDLAILGRSESFEGLRVATVRVRPLQFDPVARAFILFPNLCYALRYRLAEGSGVPGPPPHGAGRIGQYRAARVARFLDHHLVDAAADLVLERQPLPGGVYVLAEEVPHVIITDDYQWPDSAVDRGDGSGTTRAPTAAERGPQLEKDSEGHGPVDHFKRLAEWKTARGVRSRVVTVSQLLNGKFGDCTQDGFALDLQEVIRNFIKQAYQEWGTLYVLLGGDVDLIPMRSLIGFAANPKNGWDCTRTGEDPPPVRKCRVVAAQSLAKLHVDPACFSSTGVPLSTYALFTYSGMQSPSSPRSGRGHRAGTTSPRRSSRPSRRTSRGSRSRRRMTRASRSPTSSSRARSPRSTTTSTGCGTSG